MNWIERFREDANDALKEIYLSYKDEFINWSYQKHSIGQDIATEVFQTSVVILYDNVITGKLTDLSSSIKTYLFAICKNKIMEHKRRAQRNSGEEAIPNLASHVSNGDDKAEKEIKYTLMANAMREMGDPCKSLLEMYYYQQKKMYAITQALGYKNVDTTKNQKYKCMKRLQKLVSKHK